MILVEVIKLIIDINRTFHLFWHLEISTSEIAVRIQHKKKIHVEVKIKSGRYENV